MVRVRADDTAAVFALCVLCTALVLSLRICVLATVIALRVPVVSAALAAFTPCDLILCVVVIHKKLAADATKSRDSVLTNISRLLCARFRSLRFFVIAN